MRAAVLQEIGTPVAIQEVATPEPGPGQVLIRVEACGVCHSDLHLAEGDWDLLRPVTKVPLILGHEAASANSAKKGARSCALSRRSPAVWSTADSPNTCSRRRRMPRRCRRRSVWW